MGKAPRKRAVSKPLTVDGKDVVATIHHRVDKVPRTPTEKLVDAALLALALDNAYYIQGPERQAGLDQLREALKPFLKKAARKKAALAGLDPEEMKKATKRAFGRKKPTLQEMLSFISVGTGMMWGIDGWEEE